MNSTSYDDCTICLHSFEDCICNGVCGGCGRADCSGCCPMCGTQENLDNHCVRCCYDDCNGNCEACPACGEVWCLMDCPESEKQCFFCKEQYCYGDCDEGRGYTLLGTLMDKTKE